MNKRSRQEVKKIKEKKINRKKETKNNKVANTWQHDIHILRLRYLYCGLKYL